MQKDFWLERWERDEIGFHQDEFNSCLRQHWSEFQLPPDSEVFVPLCGKSRDMLWLRQQGHRILGVELSAIAVQSFFSENGYTAQRESGARFDSCTADGIRILCGDFFDLNRENMAGVAAVYDRAALIALPPPLRERYVSHLAAILPRATQILLVTFEYPQHEMQGPPFSVPAQEVERLYRGHAEVSLLASQDALQQNPRFLQRGLTRLRENVFKLKLY